MVLWLYDNGWRQPHFITDTTTAMLSWIRTRDIHDLGNVLMGTIGSSIRNQQGELMGILDDVTFHRINRQPEYAIIKSSVCFGRGIRIFAVPASSGYFELSRSAKPMLKASKDDLQFANGIATTDCPSLNFKNGQHIFELYGYYSGNQLSTRERKTHGPGAIHHKYLKSLMLYDA